MSDGPETPASGPSRTQSRALARFPWSTFGIPREDLVAVPPVGFVMPSLPDLPYPAVPPVRVTLDLSFTPGEVTLVVAYAA